MSVIMMIRVRCSGKFSIKVGNEQLDRLECEKQRIRELPQLCLTEGDFKVPVEGDTEERWQDFPEDSGPARWIPLMPDLKRRNRRYLFSRFPRGEKNEYPNRDYQSL